MFLKNERGTRPLRLPMILVALFALGTSIPLDAQDVDKLVAKGERFLERGKYAKALEHFREAAAIDASTEVNAGLSQALFGRSKDLLEAEKSLGEAESMVEEMLEIVDDPRARLAGYRLLGALIYKNSDRPDAERLERSEAAYGEALRITSGYDWASRLSLAIIERDRGTPAEAIQHLRAIDISTLDADSRLAARVMLCRLKREAQASNAAPVENPQDPPMMISGGIQKPEKIFAPSPHYTPEARRLGLTGLVIFTGSIDRDGCTNMQLAKADDPRLAAMATQAVDQWVFEPATLQGKPVPVQYNLSFKMRVNSRTVDIPLLRIDPMY